MVRFGSLWNKGNSNVREGYRALLASAFAFSLMTVCVKHLGSRLPVAEIVLARSLISILITRVMLKQAGVSPWGKEKTLLFVRGLFGTTALFCIFAALQSLPLASATVIQYTYPTFTALAAWLFLKEKVGKRIWIAVILGWVGIVLTIHPKWGGDIAGELHIQSIFIALAGAIFTALAYVCVRKLSKTEHPLVIVYYFPLVSIPITLPFIWGGNLIPVGIEWVWLIGIGALTQLGQVWITKGLSILNAAHASSINYSQVIFAGLWGIIIFNEPIDSWFVLGGICILSATLISISAKK